jgi:hypothetical protein
VLAGEQAGDGCTDTRPRAGDGGDLSRQLEHRAPKKAARTPQREPNMTRVEYYT